MDGKPELKIVTQDLDLDPVQPSKAPASCPLTRKLSDFCDALDREIDMILSL